MAIVEWYDETPDQPSTGRYWPDTRGCRPLLPRYVVALVRSSKATVPVPVQSHELPGVYDVSNEVRLPMPFRVLR